MEKPKRNTVMIVDDEEIITYSLSMHLSLSTDLNVITCNDTNTALQKLQENDVDLIISDYLMPNMNGIEFLTAAKKIKEDVTCIILTGYADKENVIKAVNTVGIYYYIEKPWDNDSLLKIVNNGIEKASLVKQLREKNELLQQLYNNQLVNIENVMLSLAYIIEAKDLYTVGHTQRVSDYAVKLATRVGLSPEKIANLKMAGLIHDIGKIGVPEIILNKPGKLTEAEFEKIKTHAAIGADICKPFDNFNDLYDMIRHHHEKLNGKGYPDGLKGDEISIEARILAIADVFDALYSDRPYRNKLPLESVMQILREEADKEHLDARLVEIVVQMIEKDEF
jgi:putative two-component system response regulator